MLEVAWMELTERQLRDRGIRRSADEVGEEAARFSRSLLAAMPVGRGTMEPLVEFSGTEARALGEGGLDLSAAASSEADVLSSTAARHAAMLATAVATTEAAALLGVGESRIRQRFKDGTLYRVRDGSGNRLPLFQFAGNGEVPNIGKVLRALDPALHPVAVQNWFTNKNPDLLLEDGESLSPRDWLIAGGSPDALLPLVREL
jgi:hypothetical protein